VSEKRNSDLFTLITADDRIVFEGYTEAQLIEAFRQVADPSDWKNPIDEFFPAGEEIDFDAVGAAVIFYCGCVATVSNQAGTTVSAIGYYEAMVF
jgi:hypothetical protein